MGPLYKECELRRFGDAAATGRAGHVVERAVRWLAADEAVIGRVVDLGEGDRWEIVSAPDPALPASIVRRLDPDGIATMAR